MKCDQLTNVFFNADKNNVDVLWTLTCVVKDSNAGFTTVKCDQMITTLTKADESNVVVPSTPVYQLGYTIWNAGFTIVKCGQVINNVTQADENDVDVLSLLTFKVRSLQRWFPKWSVLR